jgi:predicted outer membrane repeat protein
VTIEGVGAATDGFGSMVAIDGDHSSRIFEIAAGHQVVLKNMFLKNGNAKADNPRLNARLNGDGGAILNEGALWMFHCVVEYNGVSADGSGAHIPSVLKGGAIYNAPNALLNLIGTKLDENFAAIAGGGIYNDRDGAVQISSSNLVYNFTDIHGGAIYDTGSYLGVYNSDLSYNQARLGAGIFTRDDGSVTVHNTKIHDNTADIAGGAMFTFDSHVMFTANSTLQTNHAGLAGGGVYCWAGKVEFAFTDLYDNNSGGNGGGIYAFMTDVNIAYCHFDSNFTAAGATGNGGAIYMTDSTLEIDNSDLVLNRAANGGGIYQQGGSLTVTTTTLQNNTAFLPGGHGGGIDVEGGVAVVTQSKFINDEAMVDGGGIYVNGFVKVGTTLFKQNNPGGNIKGAPYIDLGGNTFI